MRYYLVMVLLVLADIMTVSLTPFLALWIRFDGLIEQQWLDTLWSFLPLIVCVRIVTFYLFRLYHRIWRYTRINELLSL